MVKKKFDKIYKFCTECRTKLLQNNLDGLCRTCRIESNTLKTKKFNKSLKGVKL